MTEANTTPVTPQPEPDSAAPEAVAQESLPAEDNAVTKRIKARLFLAADRIVEKRATLELQADKIERICRSQGDQFYVAYKQYFQTTLEDLQDAAGKKTTSDPAPELADEEALLP